MTMKNHQGLAHALSEISEAAFLQGLVDGCVSAANDLCADQDVTGAEALAVAVLARLGPGPRARLAAQLMAGGPAQKGGSGDTF